MSSSSWEHSFKPEVRSSGRALVTKGKVSASRPSDTEVQAYVRATTSFKVTFKAESMASESISVDCTCPPSRKGQFCKHIWATLLVIEDKYADFLDGKSELHKGATPASAASTAGQGFQPREQASPSRSSSPKQEEYLAAQKERAKDFRKAQYQRQKEFMKTRKKTAKEEPVPPAFPPDVETALEYFRGNGFELADSLTKQSVNFAMKKLARVFHPDMGGSHEEFLVLNKFSDVLTKFAK